MLTNRKGQLARRECGAKGFTLIELLVVIAIIAILAAILFPVFARARENARRASCQSNLKQMALAFMQYSQDYDEKMVPSYEPVQGKYWPEMVNPYIKSNQLFFCPSDSDSSHNSQVLATQTNTSYGLNWSYLTLSPYGTGGVSLAAIGSVSETVMLGDNAVVGPTVINNDYIIGWNTEQPGARHLEGANIAFVDGHVKWFKLPGVLLKDQTLWDLI